MGQYLKIITSRLIDNEIVFFYQLPQIRVSIVLFFEPFRTKYLLRRTGYICVTGNDFVIKIYRKFSRRTRTMDENT